ncbi:DUF2914 domain-containing protein [Candidatus Parcubacteria bacterium]|nr:DUF2914 domain-containing protein [Candidatus Parcubacteria bacterium]
MKKLNQLKHWYEYNERKISVISLAGGFVVDSFTIKTIDNVWDNLWLAAHLLLSALYIVLLNRKKDAEHGFWIPNLLQFSFGALFGANFIYYMRSTTLSATWPFLALLLFAMLTNEFFQKRWERLALQLSFFYFALFSFSIFVIPTFVQRIGPWIFILSGLASLLGVWLFLRLLSRFARERFLESKTHIWALVAAIFLGVNALYFTNLIPPIPLSLKDAGVYHAVEIDSRGRYLATGEKRGPEKYFTLFPEVYWQPGEPLYAYSAIFAPGELETDIVHDWQYQNAEGKWVSATRIPLHLAGGRTSGFRTFSTKYNFTPGEWRVDIETARGQVIGRVNFKIISASGPHPLVTEVKE